MARMASFSRLHEQSNQIGIDFLLTELDTAFTFLDVAETTHSDETRERNRGHAREAYETVRRLEKKVVMEPSQKTEFHRKVAELKQRLQELGFEVE